MNTLDLCERSAPQTDDATGSNDYHHVALRRDIEAACNQACQAIAPAWPLDRAIAVNPHWSRIGMPVRQVAARMAVLGSMAVFPTRSSQQQAWAEGRIITVPDVDAFPGHIVCSSASRSEIVLPLRGRSGELSAVFDVDSAALNDFGPEDERGLAELCSLIEPLLP